MKIKVDESNLNREVESMRNSLKSDRLDMSFGEVMATYERGELIISPDFQRLFRWDLSQRTRFLESILLGIPIPAIFVAEDKNGRWELVDGLQRISTILSFFGVLKNRLPENKNNWVFQEATLVPALEGFSAKTLPDRYVLNIKRAVCRVEIIKWDSKWDMRYELFSRLNTGGSPLTPQEIRNSIFRGGLNRLYAFVDEATKSDPFSSLVDLSQTKKQKMFDDELVIRYVSLVDDWRHVDSSMSVHATTFMKSLLDRKEDIKPSTPEKFYRVVKLIAPMGRSVFRVGSVFSTSLYDSIMIATSEFLDVFENHPARLRDAIKKLKADEKFRQLRGGASSRSRTKIRIQHAVDIFESVIH